MPKKQREIKPPQDRHWTWTYDEVVDMMPTIGKMASCVYLVLARMSNKYRRCWPTIDTVAKRVPGRNHRPSSKRSVQLALNVLKDHRLIETYARRDRRGRDLSNGYFLLPVAPQIQGEFQFTPGGSPVHPGGATDCARGAQPTAPQEEELRKEEEGSEVEVEYLNLPSWEEEDALWFWRRHLAPISRDACLLYVARLHAAGWIKEMAILEAIESIEAKRAAGNPVRDPSHYLIAILAKQHEADFDLVETIRRLCEANSEKPVI